MEEVKEKIRQSDIIVTGKNYIDKYQYEPEIFELRFLVQDKIGEENKTFNILKELFGTEEWLKQELTEDNYPDSYKTKEYQELLKNTYTVFEVKMIQKYKSKIKNY